LAAGSDSGPLFVLAIRFEPIFHEMGRPNPLGLSSLGCPEGTAETQRQKKSMTLRIISVSQGTVSR
jgi:hypothetical protein